VSSRRYAVVAGGGTGGHVLEALAVARALAALGHPKAEIEIVGSRRGQETTLLAGEGFPLTVLPGRGISRGRRPTDVLANIGAVAGLAWATVLATAALARSRPKAVVSVGGYASFPAAAAATVLRIPLVLVNIDAVPGLVHRVFGRFAVACAVAFPSTPLPRAVVTGTPVRQEVREVDRSPESVARARDALGIPTDRRTVGVFGGSLGARRLNHAASTLAHRWRGRSDRTLYHVTGRREWEAMGPSATGTPPGAPGDGADPGCADRLCYRRVPFEDRMPLLYEAADVVVCRAGAVTVAELAVAGVPSVLVPLPGAPGDHQTANARSLAAAGGGVLLPDDQCDGRRLEAALEELLADDELLAAMSAAASGMGHPDAAARVAALVDAHAR